MQEEESLVQQAKQGDQQAFARLYEEHFDRIYRYVIVRIGDRLEAEDMTQQVFINALESISSFRWRNVPFAAWLFRIAHNQVVDHLRKKGKRAVVPLDESLAKVDADPQLIAERNMEIEHLVLATKCLTEAQCEVISLRFTGGLSVREVADIMGRSQGAVKALQHSAIVALRQSLSVSSHEKVEGTE